MIFTQLVNQVRNIVKAGIVEEQASTERYNNLILKVNAEIIMECKPLYKEKERRLEDDFRYYVDNGVTGLSFGDNEYKLNHQRDLHC